MIHVRQSFAAWALVACQAGSPGGTNGSSSSSGEEATVDGPGGQKDPGEIERTGPALGDGGVADLDSPHMLYWTHTQALGHVHVGEEYLWYEFGSDVFQAPKDGQGEPQLIGDGVAEGGAGRRFRDDDQYLYSLSKDRIVRMPKEGGDNTSIALGRDFSFGAWDMDATHIYLTNAFASAAWRIPKDGGELEVFAQPLNEEGDMGGGVRFELIDSALYIGYQSGVWRVGTSKGQVQRLSEQVVDPTSAVEVDSKVYWLDSNRGVDLYEFDPGSDRRSPVKVAHGDFPNNATWLSYDKEQHTLYWVDGTGGSRVRRYSFESKEFAAITRKVRSNAIFDTDDEFIYFPSVETDAPGVMRVRKH